MKAQKEKKAKSVKKQNIEKNKTVDNEEENTLSKKVWGVVSYLIFFCVVIGIFLSAGDGPRVVGGYGIFNVLTRSMQSTIPQDSLVITKSVNSKEIQIGDDITYMAGPTSTITHRVIGIEEDYQRTGMRAFSTQGTDNAAKDKDMVVETNVVGKVVFHNYHMGVATVFLQDNCYFIIAYLAMFVLIKKIILRFMGDEEDEEEDSEGDEPPSESPQGNRYDTGLWDASALYEQPPNHDPYNQQGGYTYDAYGNPVSYQQPQAQNPYNQDPQNGYIYPQYDAYGQPIYNNYNEQGYDYSQQDQNQQW